MIRTLIVTLLLSASAAALSVAAYRNAVGSSVPPNVPSMTWRTATLNERGRRDAPRLFEDVTIRWDGVGLAVSLAVRRSTHRLVRTADAGRIWTDVPVRMGQLMAVALRADGIALTVGYAGAVHRSVDTGLNWTKTAQVASRDSITNEQPAVRRVAFGDRDAAIIVGGFTVMRSSDAGLTWSEVDVPHQTYSSVAFRERVWLVVGGAVLRSIDDGATWTQPQVPVRSLLRCVAFADSSTAVAVGSEGMILRTEDAGVTWKKVPSGTEHHLRAVAFADTQSGWIAGFYGTVLRTSDGGRSWRVEESGTRAHLFDVTITPGGVPLAVGWLDTIILRTPVSASIEVQHGR